MEKPHIDNIPLEEIPDYREENFNEPDISIPLDDPDALKRLEALHDEVAMAHTGRPMPENPESHEITQEDEDELETTHLTRDIQSSLKEQGYFNQNPDIWLEGVVLENDANELIGLTESGFDEQEIESLIEKMAEKYPARFKTINGGVSYSKDPAIQKINLTKEEYRDRLHERYLSKLIKNGPKQKPSPDTIIAETSTKNNLIELGEPIDDEEEAD